MAARRAGKKAAPPRNCSRPPRPDPAKRLGTDAGTGVAHLPVMSRHAPSGEHLDELERLLALCEVQAVRIGCPLPLGRTLVGTASTLRFSAGTPAALPGALRPCRGRHARRAPSSSTGQEQDWRHLARLGEGCRPGQLYGYRIAGPYAPDEGHRFNPEQAAGGPLRDRHCGSVRPRLSPGGSALTRSRPTRICPARTSITPPPPPRASSFTRTLTGVATSPFAGPGIDRHLRAARARLHHPPRLRHLLSGYLWRPDREDPVSEGTWCDRGGADAGAGV